MDGDVYGGFWSPSDGETGVGVLVGVVVAQRMSNTEFSRRGTESMLTEDFFPNRFGNFREKSLAGVGVAVGDSVPDGGGGVGVGMIPTVTSMAPTMNGSGVAVVPCSSCLLMAVMPASAA